MLFTSRTFLISRGVIGNTAGFGPAIPGSSPVEITIFGGIAQLTRASALQAEGREFESHYLHYDSIESSYFFKMYMCFTLRNHN